MLDHGLISGSNFLLGVLLARWLEPQQFGTYNLAFSSFLLISVVYQALVLEPQSVFATSTYRHEPRQYMGSLLRLHGILVFSALFLAFAAAALLTHGRHPGGSLPEPWQGSFSRRHGFYFFGCREGCAMQSKFHTWRQSVRLYIQ